MRTSIPVIGVAFSTGIATGYKATARAADAGVPQKDRRTGPLR